MQVPILKYGPYLVATFQASLTATDLKILEFNLLERVRKGHFEGVILDVSALDVIDAYATRILGKIAQLIKVGGSELIVAGIQPDVAYAMVQLGLSFDEAETTLDLEEGLEILNSRNKRRRSGVD